MVTKGIQINGILLREYENLGWIIFYLVTIEVSIQLYFLIYLAIVDALKLVNGKNEWNKRGIKSEITLLLILIVAFSMLPNVVFAMLYNFWGLLSTTDYKINVGDSIYFAFAISYSLPLSGQFSSFQEQVNQIWKLQLIQMNHIITCKLIEYVMIGFIIAKLMNLLNELIIRKTKNKKLKKRFKN